MATLARGGAATAPGTPTHATRPNTATAARYVFAGVLLTVMMWTAVLPPTTNPFMDDHLIYAAILIALALLGAGNTLGLGRTWAATPLVQRAPWLK
jgi:hypothetical protein